MAAEQDAAASVKLFAMANFLVEHDLDRIEREFSTDLRRGHSATIEADADYYPQIESDIRAEAARMAPHYEMLYSLERTIRELVSDVLAEAEGDDWWESGRASSVKGAAEDRQKRELDTGVTPRSGEPIDFTTFGELGELIKANWDLFGGMFSSDKAVLRVMASLNTLRGPVAHCSPLAEDEIVRLRLTVRDWFRLME